MSYKRYGLYGSEMEDGVGMMDEGVEYEEEEDLSGFLNGYPQTAIKDGIVENMNDDLFDNPPKPPTRVRERKNPRTGMGYHAAQDTFTSPVFDESDETVRGIGKFNPLWAHDDSMPSARVAAWTKTGGVATMVGSGLIYSGMRYNGGHSTGWARLGMVGFMAYAHPTLGWRHGVMSGLPQKTGTWDVMGTIKEFGTKVPIHAAVGGLSIYLMSKM